MNNYDKQNASGWYAPNVQAQPVRVAEETPARRGLPIGWRIALGVLLALGLIAGTSIFFSNRNRQPLSAPETESPRGDSGFSVIIPGIPGDFADILPDSTPEDVMPDDWHDYFDAYYVTEDNSSVETRVPLVETRPVWELKFRPIPQEEMTLQEIYQNCVDSIVSIRSYVDGKVGYFWGSGIVLSEDGLILTNAHVIEDCDSATVTLQDNTEYEALLVGADRTSDIAVLKIDAKGLTPAVFGDSDRLTVGDGVAAIGNPLGEEFRATLTNGIVSAIDRGISSHGHSMNLIQTNTAINEGSSGGALVNMYGQVIGVTNMKMMSNYSSIEGIAFAIPSSTARAVVNALIKDGEVRGRPAIGITVGSIPDSAAEHYDLPGGLYISGVSEDSDAYAKGIRPGDILTAVNGEEVSSSDEILQIRNGLSVGDVLTFTIWRDGETSDIEVALVEFNDIY